MTPITTALMRAIEQALEAHFHPSGDVVVPSFTELDKSELLKATFADAPRGTLYIDLPAGLPAARALWFELLEAGAEPPMTAITPGEGNGVTVLLFPEGMELYIQSDNPEEGTLMGALSTAEDKRAKWTFQRG